MKAEESSMTNLTKFYLLCLLQKKKMHGYEIMEELGRITGRKPSAGQIYPLLRTMEKNKYVKMKITKDGKRIIKNYFLTKEGIAFSKQLMKRFSELIDMAISPSLTKCSHCGCSVYKGGYTEKIKNRTYAFCCINCARSYRK